MALAQTGLYAMEDIYSLPVGQRAELIDGQMHMMASPGTDRREFLIFAFIVGIRHRRIFLCPAVLL